MTHQAKAELVAHYRKQYQRSTKKDKSQILSTIGGHRVQPEARDSAAQWCDKAKESSR